MLMKLTTQSSSSFRLIAKSIEYITFCSVRISYLIQPDVEKLWHVGQREEPVKPLGRVLLSVLILKYVDLKERNFLFILVTK